jgi:hypothetical protein
VRALALALLLLLLPTLARAQEPARERQFVYGLNVFDGTEHVTTYAPASVDAIYVLAESDAVIDPKLTEVYFWPLTNDWRADFTSLNQLVPGTLELSQGGRVVARLELVEYVLQIDQARGWQNGRLFTGPAAREARRAFEAGRAAYLEQLRVYSGAVEAHMRALEDTRRQAEVGKPVAAPEAPEVPPPLTLYSGDVGHGFHLHLPAGEYEMQLRDPGGAIVPDSRKRLAAIVPRRHGVAYEVVPQEKWTMPERADDPVNALYATPGGVAFLRPFAAIELNEHEHARLRNPQELRGAANRWTWVHVAPVEGATLRVGDQSVGMERFAVRQLPGPALGYTIVPHEGSGAPDLVAYRVQAPDGRAGRSLALIDAEGRELPGSRRELRAVPPVAEWQLALPVLVPLAVGATVALWRRERVVTLRRLSPERRQLVA